MSWFEYGELTGRDRQLRKGVWLRVRNLPQDILTEIHIFMRPNEKIEWVVVQELQSNKQVLLEFWCADPNDWFGGYKRYNVFHWTVPEDPKWICEGDLGRGFKQPKEKKVKNKKNG